METDAGEVGPVEVALKLPQHLEPSAGVPTRVGTPAEGSNVLRQFQGHLDRANLPRVRFHDLRHSAATFLLAQGVADRVVMEILGHTSLAMTSRYMHVLDGLKRDAAEQMDRLFAGTGT